VKSNLIIFQAQIIIIIGSALINSSAHKNKSGIKNNKSGDISKRVFKIFIL